MFNVKVEINNVLFNSFKTACEKVYNKKPITRKVAEIKVGTPVFKNGLKFIQSKEKNGTVTLSDGTKYDFQTAIKTKIFTI